ncbi:DegT/DnrJ/EryC1/StrS family aminotransferase [bacterium]|nr:DegT/DnrJ/EryC1/StrS family aminotransferase [bacterium]
MNIPFLDLKTVYRSQEDEINNAILRVNQSGMYILGDFVEKFEHQWSDFCQAKYCVGIGNGYDAILVALKALGIKPGDDVIVPAHTFIATWLAVSNLGANIVPVDIEDQGYNINVDLIELSLTKKTKAIIMVHMYGKPCNIDKLQKLAKKHDLYLIEDAAQAHGATYKGVPIGAHSDIVCWSFYPGKNLGAHGDAGAITTNNRDLYYKAFEIRNYGSTQKYVHNTVGVNSRMDPIQAAILSVKLKKLTEAISHRQLIAYEYLSALNNIGDLVFDIIDSNDSKHAMHLFVVQSALRDSLSTYLKQHGIGTLIHYPCPPFRQLAYQSQFIDKNYPNSDLVAKCVLSLPMGIHVGIENVQFIASKVNHFFASA